MSRGLLLDEEWRPVIGFEGFYEVSNLGRVWSVARIDKQRRARGDRFMNAFLQTGYPAIRLRKDGATKLERVHILVLEAFVGPCPSGMQGCHEDDIRINPVLSNLRWDTPKGNGEDRVKNGRSAMGERNGQTSLTNDQVLEIKRRIPLEIGTHIARDFGIDKGTIYDIKKGRRWAHV